MNAWEATLFIPGAALNATEPPLNRWFAGGSGKFEGNNNAEVAYNILMKQVSLNHSGTLNRQGFPTPFNTLTDAPVPFPELPNTIGKTVEDAIAFLRFRGFQVQIDPIPVASDIPAGKVAIQDPMPDLYPVVDLEEGGPRPWGPHQPVVIKLSNGP